MNSTADFQIDEISFRECLPLLQELWPDAEVIPSIDNLLGMIKFTGREIINIKPKFFVAKLDNEYVACTQAYMTGKTELRIRGTFCRPEFRRTGIAKKIVQYAIEQFPEAKLVYTFPRIGSEKFYESLGFQVTKESWPIYQGVKYGKMQISP